MNIQIFIGKKNFDCQKAERWFKERNIKFQSVDLLKKGLSPREFDAVAAQVGLLNMIDTEGKPYQESPIRFMLDKGLIKEGLLANPKLLKSPIVRNGAKATIGYHPEIWESWE